MGIDRCVLRGGGTEPLLIKWFNWYNINITSIAISIDFPFHVATLGRYFTTCVWHPFSRPPPTHRSSTVNFRTSALRWIWVSSKSSAMGPWLDFIAAGAKRAMITPCVKQWKVTEVAESGSGPSAERLG